MAQLWQDIPPGCVPSTLNLFDEFYPLIDERSRTLDIGCGPGRISHHICSGGIKDVVGIDINSRLLAKASTPPPSVVGYRPTFVAGDARSLPFHSETFDLTIMQALLTIIATPEERQQCLAEAHRVLRGGGYLYLADFALTVRIPQYKKRYEESGVGGEFPVFDENTKELLYHAHHFSAREFEHLGTQVGFHIVSLT